MNTAIRWLFVAALVACAAFLFRFDPQDERYSSLYPPCPFHELTGLRCPGCGTLRAMHDLLHGRIAEALGHNAAATLFVPFALWYALYAFGIVSVSPGLDRWSWHILAAVVLFWILRNLPFAPFAALAP